MGNPGQEERLRLGRLLIANLEKNAELIARLPNAGVDVDRMREEGEGYLAQYQANHQRQIDLEAKLPGMWQTLHADHDAQWTLFEDPYKLAKVVIKNAEIATAMKLNEKYQATRPQQLRLMRDFYHNALLRPAAIAALASVSVTQAMLEQGRAAVDKMITLEDEITIVDGAKQDATQLKDEALDHMDEWRFAAYKRIEIVTEDRPQIREQVGMVVKGSTKRT